MKILHVHKWYLPEVYGGMEEAIKNICHETARYGCQHTLFVLSRNPDNYPSKIDVINICRSKILFEKFSCPISLEAFKTFKKLAEQNDIIHFHYPWPFADLLYLFSGIKKPSLISYHSDIVRQKILKLFYQPLMNNFFSKVDYIVPASPNILNSSKDLKKWKEKCIIIPYGICKNSIIEPKLIEHWKNLVGNDFFLFVGVLRYYKGLEILLKALYKSNIQLVIAGAGPEDAKLKLLAENLKLTNVKFIGFIKEQDKFALLKLCNAVVLPSKHRSEAFGISLLEGLQMGKPLISTELGTGTSFVNKNGDTGFVISPDNPAELRAALEKLQHDVPLRKQMGRNSYLYYQSIFTAEKMGLSYLNLYKNLLNPIS